MRTGKGKLKGKTTPMDNRVKKPANQKGKSKMVYPSGKHS